MYKYSELKAVHLEITSKCNASCPQCGRNIRGGAVNPNLPLSELFLEDIKSLFPLSLLKRLQKIYMCGNYGDPMAARDTLKAFQFFRSANPALYLVMFTNGSGRPASWWKELASAADTVHFSIDGLEDTNPVYRRGTDFRKIMKSAESYIAAGGKAVWDYIVFRHNEHQIEEARNLARKTGFSRFVLKKTGRFFDKSKGREISEQAVFNKKGEMEYYLRPAENPLHRNPSLNRAADLAKKYGSFHEYLNSTSIKCRVAEEKSVYISAEGLVFPCCWTAGQLYPWYLKKRSGELWRLIDRLPEKELSLSAKKQSLEKIIHGDFFQKTLPESWGKSLTRCGGGGGGVNCEFAPKPAAGSSLPLLINFLQPKIPPKRRTEILRPV